MTASAMPADNASADLRHYARDITRRTCLLAGALVLASMAMPWAGKSVAFGIALGAAFGIAKLWRRTQNLERFARGTAAQQTGILVRGRLESYLWAAVAIALAFTLDGVHTWAAVASLFLVNIVMVATASRSLHGAAQ